MAKGIDRVIQAFFQGRTAKDGNVHAEGGVLYSYSMPIARMAAGVVEIVDYDDAPSATTKQHVRAVASSLLGQRTRTVPLTALVAAPGDVESIYSRARASGPHAARIVSKIEARRLPPPITTKRSANAVSGGETMLAAYMRAALWSSTDESTPSGGYPLDKNYDASDITREGRDKMLLDCTNFLRQAGPLVDGDYEQAGHDFWLTRNGHGAGFWDGRWPEPAGKRLTAIAESFGEQHLTVHRGRIYVD